MNWLQFILLLLAAFAGVFAEATLNIPRRWLGAQFHVLPPLMVYAALRGEVSTVAGLACVGGLWQDALSADPLGVSVLPLIGVGLLLHRARDLVLRDLPYAQYVLGAGSSAIVMVIKLGIVLTVGADPLVGWGTLWQIAFTAVTGGLISLAAFAVLDGIKPVFAYQPILRPTFRTDREVKRGRY